jgi:hypothetical protein
MTNPDKDLWAELAEGHLALDRIGSPREIQEGDVIRECLIAERIAASRPSMPEREKIIAAMCQHFKTTIEASAGMPFAETDVHLPIKSFEGYADAILALIEQPGEKL